jgi:hypothetical protein
MQTQTTLSTRFWQIAEQTQLGDHLVVYSDITQKAAKGARREARLSKFSTSQPLSVLNILFTVFMEAL